MIIKRYNLEDFILKKNIKCIYVSKHLQNSNKIQKKISKKYKLEEYLPNKNSNNTTLFFGFYSIDDYNIILNNTHIYKYLLWSNNSNFFDDNNNIEILSNLFSNKEIIHLNIYPKLIEKFNLIKKPFFHIKISNEKEEKIHIILCYWKRIENLEKQINNLNEQTVSDKIILHLINNNLDNKEYIENIISKLSPNLKIKIKLSHYDNKYSCFQRFFYIRDKIMYNYYCTHVIIIDDDQLFHNNWVKQMYMLKKPNTFISWYVKKWNKTNTDYWNGSIINFTRNALGDKIYLKEEFDYGGPGGSIIDISIFDKKSELWDIPLSDKFNVYQIDDIWLSFVAKHYYNWSIKFSCLYEKESLNYSGSNSQKKSLYLTLKNEKQSLFDYLINNFGYIK